jgi:hypothetical protein
VNKYEVISRSAARTRRELSFTVTAARYSISENAYHFHDEKDELVFSAPVKNTLINKL